MTSFAYVMERFFTGNNSYTRGGHDRISVHDRGAIGLGDQVLRPDDQCRHWNHLYPPRNAKGRSERRWNSGVDNTGERHWDQNNDGSIATSEKTW